MKNKNKRFICVVMIFSMLLTYMPVYAEEVESGSSTQELVVIEGQAIIASSIYNSEFIEIDGFINNSATFDGTNLIFNGALVMEVQEIEGNKDETILAPAGITRYNDPAFGVPSDYTVYQGVTNRSVKFENLLRNLTALVIATRISIWTGSPWLGVGIALVDVAMGLGSNSKTSYLKEYCYGHKTIPGLYHKYVQDWYVESDYTGYAATSIVYDAWS